MDGKTISELYCAICDWALSQGAKDLRQSPGVWHGKTQKGRVLGPLDVRVNPHDKTIDHIPPFHIQVGMDDYFPGIIALLNPVGGTLLGSRVDGEDEAGLIAHFKEQKHSPSP